MTHTDKASEKVFYRVARTRKELEQALSLVYKEYLNRGYIPKGYKSKLRISLHNALPATTVFVAMKSRKVVASVTLIPDSPLGIPMDKLYKSEVDKLRKRGGVVAEVSQLSINTKLFGTGFFSMFNFNKLIFLFRLFKLILDHAVNIDGITDFCIAVNPKQQYLYKFLGFEQIGALKYYGFVNRAPAVAFRLKLSNVEDKMRNRKGLYKIFFGSQTNPKLFENKFKFTLKELEYFFVKKSDMFEKATKEQIHIIRKYYPKEKFDKIIKC